MYICIQIYILTSILYLTLGSYHDMEELLKKIDSDSRMDTESATGMWNYIHVCTCVCEQNFYNYTSQLECPWVTPSHRGHGCISETPGYASHSVHCTLNESFVWCMYFFTLPRHLNFLFSLEIPLSEKIAESLTPVNDEDTSLMTGTGKQHSQIVH